MTEGELMIAAAILVADASTVHYSMQSVHACDGVLS